MDISASATAFPSSSTRCAVSSIAATIAPASPSSTRREGWRVAEAEGKLSRLAERLNNGEALSGVVGIGHTRWATHGRPSDANAHPHLDCTEGIAVVHNGIIENYASLRARLGELGHVFRSETDTEVLAHLIELHYDGNLEEAVRRTLREVRGAYALGVISSDDPEHLVFARNGASPLVIGIGDGEMYVASDTPAILPYTRREVILQEGEIAVVGRDGFRLTDYAGSRIEREPIAVTWDAGSAEKSGFKHFMLKEIFEQPQVIKETLSGRIDDFGDVHLGAELGAITPERLQGLSKIAITGCGTAFHAGLVGMYLLRSLVHLPVEMETGERVSLRRPGHRSHDLGDCDVAVRRDRRHRRGRADRQAVRLRRLGYLQRARIPFDSARGRHALYARRTGNRRGRNQNLRLPSGCVDALRALSCAFAGNHRRGKPSCDRRRHQASSGGRRRRSKHLRRDSSRGTRQLRKSQSVLFIGRYVNFPTALEGALKLKEISYIHAEGYPAGEMKHGPIALLDPSVPVVGIMTEDRVREKMLSNLMESKAREAPIIVVANIGDDEAKGVADHVFWVPRVHEPLSPIVNVIPLQLLAYHIADIEGKDVDQPRNLAKTVTVE